MANVMLTTLSNPFNPFTQFDEWYDYDVTSGANSAALLARLALTSDEFTDEENDEIIEEACDTICNFDANYIKVTPRTAEILQGKPVPYTAYGS